MIVVAVARTTSDAIGQVMFPDVPPGLYVVKVQRDGFADTESAPFTVQPVCCLHRGGSLAVCWAQLSFPSLMQKSKGLLEEGR